MRRTLTQLELAVTIVGLAAGIGLRVAGRSGLADPVLMVTTVVGLAPLLVEVVRDLLARRPGVDLIAAIAMGGALALGEYLAGAVIAVMLAGGRALEASAGARAHRELAALLAGAPRLAHRYGADGILDTPVGEVLPGDLLLVRPGDVVPVDGVVASVQAVLDESALSGESRLVERTQGDQARSGTVNAGQAFDLRAIASAEQSTYAGIVRLVEEAERQKAPFVRLADRYALAFVPVTLAVAVVAWIVSGDPVRALAVLVVATPCPLILAAPIAIVSGISQAARRGIIVKGGGPLETLARGRTLLFDKTGTLTAGSPRLAEVAALGGRDEAEVLHLAGSLDQVSAHVLAAAIVRAARARGIALAFPTDATEVQGRGIEGSVDGVRVRIGSGAWVAGEVRLPAAARELRRRSAMEGASLVFVSADGELIGALLLDDPIRPDTPRAIRALRRAGIRRVVMVTGDRPDVAETVGAVIGVDGVLAERTPAEKVADVRSERASAVTVMVGDGINDAPALAAADVGVAMGARGATASSEAADVVITVDRLDRIAEAVATARRARRIAVQSVIAGMAMSFAAMAVAAVGLLPPVTGAILQELIDVAAIMNALRALGRRGLVTPPRPEDVELGRRLQGEHRELVEELERLRALADRVDALPPAEARERLEQAARFLTVDLARHEREEEASVYPAMARAIGGEDPLAALTRSHLEIDHLARVFDRIVQELPETGPEPEDLPELRRLLYGLHAVLRLHFAQEEEASLPLEAAAS